MNYFRKLRNRKRNACHGVYCPAANRAKIQYETKEKADHAVEYDNGGDVSGHYHIYFTAYVDHNRERTISVELFFPDARIPPFTLFPPNPYKDKGKKMSNWLIGNIEVSEETSK